MKFNDASGLADQNVKSLVTKIERAESLLDRVLLLENNLIRARKHFQRIYDSSDKAGIVEGECSAAINSINTALEMSRDLIPK